MSKTPSRTINLQSTLSCLSYSLTPLPQLKEQRSGYSVLHIANTYQMILGAGILPAGTEVSHAQLLTLNTLAQQP